MASIFKMEDITVMGAAELFPHLFRIWVSTLFNQNCHYAHTMSRFRCF